MELVYTFGQMKDMACRTLLLKLESLGRITLPTGQGKLKGYFSNLRAVSY